jgi:hypothetical protein
LTTDRSSCPFDVSRNHASYFGWIFERSDIFLHQNTTGRIHRFARLAVTCPFLVRAAQLPHSYGDTHSNAVRMNGELVVRIDTQRGFVRRRDATLDVREELAAGALPSSVQGKPVGDLQGRTAAEILRNLLAQKLKI